MPTQFEYSGVDGSGQPIKGLVQDESPVAAVIHLKESAVTVYSIKKKLLPEHQPIGAKRKISSSDLITFNVQLASLLRSRLPLTDSLRHLSKEMKKPRLEAVLERLTGRLEAGQSLSESLASHKEYFPPLYISMVEAGEKSGNLAEVLFQASNYYKTIDDFRKKFTNVLIYPAMLTLLSVGVIIFLVKLMVPPYVDMYSGFQADFPLSLKFLVSLEEFLRPNVFWGVIAPALLVGLIAFVFSTRRNEAMRMRAGMAILKIPLWGRMIKEAILSRSIATLVILLRSGVPLCESLSIIRDLISNRPLKKAFESAAEQVSEGEPLSQALLKQPVFPLELAMVIRSGEARGELVDSLDSVNKMCQGNFEFSSRMILSVAEPALLVVLGIVVVSMAVSLFYPLYSLVTYLGT